MQLLIIISYCTYVYYNYIMVEEIFYISSFDPQNDIFRGVNITGSPKDLILQMRKWVQQGRIACLSHTVLARVGLRWDLVNRAKDQCLSPQFHLASNYWKTFLKHACGKAKALHVAPIYILFHNRKKRYGEFNLCILHLFSIKLSSELIVDIDIWNKTSSLISFLEFPL